MHAAQQACDGLRERCLCVRAGRGARTCMQAPRESPLLPHGGTRTEQAADTCPRTRACGEALLAVGSAKGQGNPDPGEDTGHDKPGPCTCTRRKLDTGSQCPVHTHRDTRGCLDTQQDAPGYLLPEASGPAPALAGQTGAGPLLCPCPGLGDFSVVHGMRSGERGKWREVSPPCTRLGAAAQAPHASRGEAGACRGGEAARAEGPCRDVTLGKGLSLLTRRSHHTCREPRRSRDRGTLRTRQGRQQTLGPIPIPIPIPRRCWQPPSQPSARLGVPALHGTATGASITA